MNGGDNANTEQIRQVAMPIYEARLWMKLVGVLSILSGLLTAITIIGIIVAWLPIWMGVLLFQAASQAENAHASGDLGAMVESLRKIKTYFIITGVVTLLGLLWGLFWIFVVVGIGVLGAAGSF